MPKLVGKSHRFRAAGRRESFDWSPIADGRVWRLEKGVDFDGEARAMQNAAHAAARRRRLDVTTETTPEGDLLVCFKKAAANV